MTKNTRIALIAGAVLLVLAAAMGLLYAYGGQAAGQGHKTVEVTVVFAGESPKSNTHTINTSEDFLLGALRQQGLVEGEDSPAGFYITAVEGVAADPEKQQWWCITKGGEMVMTGVAQLPIADGDAFELTLTVGW